MKNKEQVSESQRPYDCCLKYGPQSLTDAQLLAVILRTGTKGKSATDLAEHILRLSSDVPGLLGICHLSVDELMSVPGIGEVKAIQMKCIGELSKRIAMRNAKERLSFGSPESIADYYMERLRHEEQEHLICAMLDTKNHLIGDECITIGTVNASLLSAREIFLSAMKFRAVSIVLIHNHPSGDPEPSDADCAVTDKIARAGELLDIRLLDHIVIGDRCYVSFAENGLLPSMQKET
ncbi:MAG: DNA repair protein RadC [Lachnospiraceae bacterium]|nr:DNA repair protein RadC [Lachnospiraceae bacterium]